MIHPSALVELAPDIWELIPLADVKGVKKPSDGKIADNKMLWSGGPHGGMKTALFHEEHEYIAQPLIYAWRYTIGKSRFGYYAVGHYEPELVVDVDVTNWRGEVVGSRRMIKKMTWVFAFGVAARRALLPEMVPPKKQAKPKVDESSSDSQELDEE